jgi:hypothetical protein
VDAQARSWKRSGPPLNVAALHIAAALGVDLLKSSDRQDKAQILEMDQARPTLADLAGGTLQPVAGGDTTAASAAVLAKLKELLPDGR